jgi:hypothetical protein
MNMTRAQVGRMRHLLDSNAIGQTLTGIVRASESFYGTLFALLWLCESVKDSVMRVFKSRERRYVAFPSEISLYYLAVFLILHSQVLQLLVCYCSQAEL